MRKDPPVDTNYNNCLHLLSLAENNGARVYNNPRAIKEFNEKVFALYFSDYIPDTIITSDIEKVIDFQKKHKNIIVKPLDGMGGASIFRVKANDPNLNVILETITDQFTEKVMIQEFIPEITEGDKRILIVDGKPMSASIARVPAEGELRGNLAAGASAVAKSLSDRDLWICEEVGPSLVEKGLLLVGLDIIGDYLTEINITSPTCFKEYKELCDINVAEIFIESVEEFSK